MNKRYGFGPAPNLAHAGALAANPLKPPPTSLHRPKPQIYGPASLVDAAPFKPCLKPVRPDDSLHAQGVISARAPGEIPPSRAAMRHTPPGQLHHQSLSPLPQAKESRHGRLASAAPRDNLRYASAVPGSYAPEQRPVTPRSSRPRDNIFASGAVARPGAREPDIMPLY